MLGELAVLYLFLGGAGAGCVAACSLVDLLWLREPFGATAVYGPDPAVDPARRAVALGLPWGLACSWPAWRASPSTWGGSTACWRCS